MLNRFSVLLIPVLEILKVTCRISIVNVISFAIGVTSGHMILNMLLYVSQTKTIKLIKNPIFAVLGSIAFVILGTWGQREVIALVQHMFV